MFYSPSEKIKIRNDDKKLTFVFCDLCKIDVINQKSEKAKHERSKRHSENFASPIASALHSEGLKPTGRCVFCGVTTPLLICDNNKGKQEFCDKCLGRLCGLECVSCSTRKLETLSLCLPPKAPDEPKPKEPEPKEPKPEPEREAQPEPKPEPEHEPKPEPKPQSKPEHEPEPKLEPKPEPKPEPERDTNKPVRGRGRPKGSKNKPKDEERKESSDKN